MTNIKKLAIALLLFSSLSTIAGTALAACDPSCQSGAKINYTTCYPTQPVGRPIL